MAVMKADQFKPIVKDAVVLDLGDIHAAAQRITEAAQAKAQKIEADARLRAEVAAQDAAREACEKGRADGHAEGLEAGRKQGRDQVFNEMKPRLEALEANLLDVTQKLDAAQSSIETEARHAVLELAMRLAERIVHRAIETDPAVVVDQVGTALSHVLGKYEATVLVHPDDATLIEEALPNLQKKAANLTHIHIVEDESISRGGCVVQYGQGEIDATVDTQLQRIVELLMPVSEASEETP